jgi:hypothetical protein
MIELKQMKRGDEELISTIKEIPPQSIGCPGLEVL